MKNIFKKIITLICLTFILIGFTAPFHSLFAQTKSTDYQLLEPLPCQDGTPGCDGGKLTTFDPTLDPSKGENSKLGVYLNIILRLFIGICAVLAVIMIVKGGIEYMTSELPGNKGHGKETIMNAIFGLLLALGAYAILFTINPNLLNTDLSSLKQQTVEVNISDSVPQPRPAGNQTYPNSNYKFDDPWGNKIGAVQAIPGVTKNYQECTTVGQTNCLSTRNLNLGSINEIKIKCPGAPLGLNGGTEFWQHGGATYNTTHGPGSATIDLQSNSALNSCLSGLPPGQQPIMYHRYGPGNLYYYEGGHWHIGR